MKPYFKNPINVVIFVLLMVSTLCPVVAFGGDCVAYIMGYHHGFTEPWPTIQYVLYWPFPVMLLVFVVDLIVYLTLKSKKKIA